MTFYLGTHQPTWLATAGVPLFVSARRLRGVRQPYRASAPWALDSGAFTEIATYGRWEIPAQQYADEARNWMNRIGNLDFAAPQDWMCEPDMIARTGLSIPEHQRRTLDSYSQLRQLAPDVPWIPVLQGWTLEDYLRHADDYAATGIDLASLPRVGLGSVCRRQATGEAAEIVVALAGKGIALHLFGFKTLGLLRCGAYAASSDSMAWSLAARNNAPLPGCHHKNCANCLRYALCWRRNLLAKPGACPAVHHGTRPPPAPEIGGGFFGKISTLAALKSRVSEACASVCSGLTPESRHANLARGCHTPRKVRNLLRLSRKRLAFAPVNRVECLGEADPTSVASPVLFWARGEVFKASSLRHSLCLDGLLAAP